MPDDDGRRGEALSPDEAFAVLGNETRMDVLQVLGAADEALSFSELHDRVDYDAPGNFSYHLDKLGEHFLRHTDRGYELTQAGKRVVKSVLSGAVTELPVMGSTHPSGWECPYCGGPAEIGYDRERVWTACPTCPGTYAPSLAPGAPLAPADYGYIGHARLPPAALEGRTPREVAETAATWGHVEFLTMASGVCSRCGARVEQTVRTCRSHEASDGLCAACDCRHAVQLLSRCTNCIHEEVTPFALGSLVATIPLLAFLIDHDVNPVAPTDVSRFYRAILDYEEVVESTDPFEARFTFSLDGDELTLTVDDALTVVDVTRDRTDRP